MYGLVEDSEINLLEIAEMAGLAILPFSLMLFSYALLIDFSISSLLNSLSQYE